MAKSRRGEASATIALAKAGCIASSHGNANATPTPCRNRRRESAFPLARLGAAAAFDELLRVIFICSGREDFGRSPGSVFEHQAYQRPLDRVYAPALHDRQIEPACRCRKRPGAAPS